MTWVGEGGAPRAKPYLDLTKIAWVNFTFSYILPRALLKCYVTAELMNWAEVTQQYEKELRQGTADCLATQVFLNDEEGNKRWDDFRKRIVEHVSIITHGIMKLMKTRHVYFSQSL